MFVIRHLKRNNQYWQHCFYDFNLLIFISSNINFFLSFTNFQCIIVLANLLSILTVFLLISSYNCQWNKGPQRIAFTSVHLLPVALSFPMYFQLAHPPPTWTSSKCSGIFLSSTIFLLEGSSKLLFLLWYLGIYEECGQSISIYVLFLFPYSSILSVS